MPGPAVVLFDLDGTLVDHASAARAGVVGWLCASNFATREQCDDKLVALWDDVAERHFPAFRAGETSFQEQRRCRLREFLPHVGIRADQLSEQELDATFDAYLRHYEAAWCAYDDVVPCLTDLRDVRVAVLSNGDQAQQENKLRRTGLHAFFEAVLTSSSLGSSKPYPEAYRLACDRLGVAPDMVMYVGDRPEVDAQASTAAGLHGVWLDRGAPMADGRYHPRITSLRDLPGLLRL